MSFRALNWAWERQGLTPVQKLVLVCLADRANDGTMKCNPGLNDLRARTCTAEKAIRNAIKVLAAKGLIRHEVRKGIGANFTMLVDNLAKRTPPPARDPRQEPLPLSPAPDTGPQEGGKARGAVSDAGGVRYGVPLSPVSGASKPYLTESLTVPESSYSSGSSKNDDDRGAAVIPIRPEAKPAREWSPRVGQAPALEEELAAVDAWNALQARLPSLRPATRDMDGTRLRQLREALRRVGGLDGWRDLLRTIEQSAFWRGETRHRRQHSLGHVLEPETVTKLMEGFYDDWSQAPSQVNGQRNGHATPMTKVDRAKALAAEAIRRRMAREGGPVIDGEADHITAIAMAGD